MTRFFLPAVALAVSLLFAGVSSAQGREYWVHIRSFGKVGQAFQLIQDLADGVPALHIFEAADGNFVVASGEFTKDSAAELRNRLIDAGIISDSSAVIDGEDFRVQLWPAAEPTEPAQPAAETTAANSQASQEKALFDEGEKLAAQIALAWSGDYRGAIDGIFGPRTRAAVQAFQRRNSIDPTGQLTRGQFDLLIRQHNQEVEKAGYKTVEHEPAGISIGIPRSMLEFSRTDIPFIYYDPTPGNRLQLFLISMPGNRVTLEALYNLFLGFEFMPEGGHRSLERQRFAIQSRNDRLNVYADVRLFERRVKGFLLLWHPDIDPLMTRMSRSMSADFQESSESTFSIPLGSNDGDDDSFFAGLKIPRPKSRHSGFFIDSVGTVATSSSVASACSGIMLAPDQKMTVAADSPADGVALLTPAETQVPLAHARFQPSRIASGAQITASGYSFGGELGAPSQSHGRWIGRDPSADKTERYLAEVEAYPGDFGGPVLDKTGAVVGMLREQSSEGKILPEGVQPVAPASAIASLATSIGKSAMYSFSGGKLVPSDLNRLASDMTVLIDCYSE